MLNFKPAPYLFSIMAKAINEYSLKNKRLIICNEGGSRSSKTWTTFYIIIWICLSNKNKNLDIYILRNTLVKCRDYTWRDFVKVLKLTGVFRQDCIKESPKPYYNLCGNNIYARGLDDENNSEGYPSDILFFNEVLEIQKSQVSGLQMRCRKLIIFDWNPKFTKHFIFDYENQPGVIFTKTTYKHNPFLESAIVSEIESYEPNEINIKNRTVDLFRWRVYGLGLRTDQEGNIFNDSKLLKFDFNEFDYKDCTIIAYADVADQGEDYFSMPIGAIFGKQLYIIDWIFTQKPIEFWSEFVYNAFEKYDITKAIFESNNQGLMATKLIKNKISPKYKNRIKAAPNSANKHSRIITMAEVTIIPNFCFPKIMNGQFYEAYEFLLNYKYDKSYKKDDAPDSLAGLAKLFNLIV